MSDIHNLDHNLDRFIDAQKTVYYSALNELKAGKKRTHWMWFIFPQQFGLGSSRMSEYYGIKNIEEAKAYLNHPVLGPRLIACVEAILPIPKSLKEIFDYPDNVKFISCMKLFAMASENPDNCFYLALSKWDNAENITHFTKLT